MKIYKEETPDGTLQTITFRADDGQTIEGFKNEVKAWLVVNQPMGWEEFFNRLVMLEATRITISMATGG